MRERRDKPDLFWCQAGEKASEATLAKHSSVYGQVKDKKHVQGRVCPRRDKRRSRLKTAGRAIPDADDSTAPQLQTPLHY